ncbi:MAG: queuosine precursor transporter [Anaerolineae bacterium]|nr:queuosine precursor transporter [Anaerolineae bacterium]MDW8171810.1 queuosine precursor transporter [Anaerolineae bacterium]
MLKNTLPSAAAPLPAYKYLSFITASLVAVLLVSNITATKIIALGPLVFDGGTLLFPLAYIFGDVLTEVYGYRASRRVIWTGFFWVLMSALIFQVVVLAPPAKDYPLQESFAAILGQTPRILVASLLGYWLGEFSNSYTLARLKVITEGRWLWLRTISSTLVGQGLDSAVFVLVAFVGLYDGELLLTMIASNYVFKVAVEVAFTPVTYAVVGWLKRSEGVDTYDRQTNFNPFALNA